MVSKALLRLRLGGLAGVASMFESPPQLAMGRAQSQGFRTPDSAGTIPVQRISQFGQSSTFDPIPNFPQFVTPQFSESIGRGYTLPGNPVTLSPTVTHQPATTISRTVPLRNQNIPQSVFRQQPSIFGIPENNQNGGGGGDEPPGGGDEYGGHGVNDHHGGGLA